MGEIEKLYPSMRESARLFLCEAKDINAFLFCGYRSFDKQAELYAQGRTMPGDIVTNARPGYSFHQFGLAIDVVFGGPGKWSWNKTNPWEKLWEIGEKYHFHPRGRDIGDSPHFDRNYGADILDLRTKYLERGLISDVWAYLNHLQGLEI